MMRKTFYVACLSLLLHSANGLAQNVRKSDKIKETEELLNEFYNLDKQRTGDPAENKSRDTESRQNTQLSEEEYNKLNSEQKKIYDMQAKEIKEKRERAIFKAEDREKMAQEMKMDGAKFAGTYYGIKASDEKEKAEKAAREEQKLLDNAAREAIKNNEKNNMAH